MTGVLRHRVHLLGKADLVFAAGPGFAEAKVEVDGVILTYERG